MKSKLLFKAKIKFVVIVCLVMGVVLEGVLAYIAFGMDIMDEKQITAFKYQMIMFSTAFIAGILLLFAEFLAVSQNCVARYTFFIKRQQMLWSDVTDIAVEDRTITQGRLTQTVKCIVIKDFNGNEILFFHDDKTFSKLCEYYEDVKKYL